MGQLLIMGMDWRETAALQHLIPAGLGGTLLGEWDFPRYLFL